MLESMCPSLTVNQHLGSEALPLELAANDLLDAIGTIRRSARRQAHRPKELSELTGAQTELLRLVRRRPGTSVAQAAAELRLAPNTVSTLVRQLSDLGHLERRVNESDRRVARLELSEDTARKMGAFRDRRVAAMADAMRRLPRADQRRLRGTVAVLMRVSLAMEYAETDA
jgi:DNA-binding MarR family transcriptional regulator